MRRLPTRPALPVATSDRLAAKTNEIVAVVATADRVDAARQRYNSARGAVWFQPVVSALRELCGASTLCMYCSSTEPSQVEHFRPLRTFPEQALVYENFLWACDICNRSYKGDRFPVDATTGAPQLLNPLEDNVWDFFFLDDTHGRLICRVDATTGLQLARATSTAETIWA